MRRQHRLTGPRQARERQVKIRLGKERVLSQAPADVRGWGPWQFPRVFDGGDTIYLEFHVSADSARSYGNPRVWLNSSDGGQTWSECDSGGLRLDSGELIKPFQPRALTEAEAELPESIGTFYGYGFRRDYFDYSALDPQYRRWYTERHRPGREWETVEAAVDLPGYTMNTSEGVFPLGYFHQLKKGPGGSLWTCLYKHYVEDGRISDHSASWFHKSIDGGRTFEFVSRVPYQYDLQRDPGAEKRYGFGEPDMCFVDDERAFSLHRTTDGTGIGPMYISWTDDVGQSWTRPEYFDDLGVWPQTVKLDNGVILAGYGRPGLFLRPFLDGAWHDRIAVVEPAQYQKDTCSYCALIAVGADTALVFYSDFNYPDADGVPRKSIMVREVFAEA